jgi:hypothetical protein
MTNHSIATEQNSDQQDTDWLDNLVTNSMNIVGNLHHDPAMQDFMSSLTGDVIFTNHDQSSD